MRRFGYLVFAPISMALFVATHALAAPPPPETSLNTCQDKLRIEGKKFVNNTVTAVSNCLKKVAIDLIKNNSAITATTSKVRVTEFRKLNDTRVVDKSIEEKFKQNVDKKCDSGSPNVTHTINDITAHLGGGGAEKINSVNSDTWCKHFGGDGSIDTVAEWEDCQVASFNCQVAAAIASQYPRSAEWLTALIAPLSNMNLVVPPVADPTKTSDAVSGASDMRDLIDPDGDGIPSPRCGGEGVACVSGCCYVENVAAGGAPDAQCFEYTGTAAQIATFLKNCTNGIAPPAFFVPGSIPAGNMINSSVPFACLAPSPLFGTPYRGAPRGRQPTRHSLGFELSVFGQQGTTRVGGSVLSLQCCRRGFVGPAVPACRLPE